MKLMSVGLGNYVSTDRVIAVVSPESAPVKRLVQEARDKGLAIDATYGRRTRAVIVMDSNQVVLSPVLPETICDKENKKGKTPAEE